MKTILSGTRTEQEIELTRRIHGTLPLLDDDEDLRGRWVVRCLEQHWPDGDYCTVRCAGDRLNLRQITDLGDAESFDADVWPVAATIK